MYTGSRLIELLEQQHQMRSQSGLFQTGIFTLQWRAKVGSFPHPDLETLVSAGEPCGTWRPSQGRPEDKRNVGQNWNQLQTLPLNGYIPGASIRGLVRAWAMQRPEIWPRMHKLLGNQDNSTISAGKIEFLDAWPVEPTQLTLDIVNPQQQFQVYHQGQSTPLSLYTLGNGEAIDIKVAIRGIPRLVKEAEVQEVWNWVQQALLLYGVGSRTASGYGTLSSGSLGATPDPEHAIKQFEFSLFSQGSAGPDTGTMELRPSHWRGWLRSWVLRFLLGVMSKENAETTVGELLGTLEPDSRKGCVRLQMVKGQTWGEVSVDRPTFYIWKGKLLLHAPSDTLNKIILPIVRFAVSVGGVGRGWRRPLHVFHMRNGRAAARGTHLALTHQLRNKSTKEWETNPYGLPIDADFWTGVYGDWLTAVKSQWPGRVTLGNHNIIAEVFSPTTCAVYAVPGPDVEPLARRDRRWQRIDTKAEIDAEATRGDGMYLIYQETPPRNYKRNREVGGDAAGGGNAHCSWVSIKRVNIAHKQEETDCQEVVCLFIGGETPQSNHVRSRFLGDLARMTGATHLFGVKSPTP